MNVVLKCVAVLATLSIGGCFDFDEESSKAAAEARYSAGARTSGSPERDSKYALQGWDRQKKSIELTESIEQGKKDLEKLTRYCGQGNGAVAYAMAQRQVESHLKAPSSARFASYGSEAHAIPDGNCGFVVSGFVDSQNSFGAMLRKYFVVKLKYNIETDRWHLVNLSM